MVRKIFWALFLGVSAWAGFTLWLDGQPTPQERWEAKQARFEAQRQAEASPRRQRGESLPDPDELMREVNKHKPSRKRHDYSRETRFSDCAPYCRNLYGTGADFNQCYDDCLNSFGR